MAVEFTPFGRLHDGRQVTAAKLKNRAGASVTVLDYGAAVQSLCVPARDGSLVDVVLGYDTAEEYERSGDFLGATIGRVANRIGGAEFELHGNVYRLEKYDEAISAFQRAASAASSELEAKCHYNIGNCLFRQGKLKESLESYKRANELDRDDEDTKANIEYVTRLMKEPASVDIHRLHHFLQTSSVRCVRFSFREQ